MLNLNKKLILIVILIVTTTVVLPAEEKRFFVSIYERFGPAFAVGELHDELRAGSYSFTGLYVNLVYAPHIIGIGFSSGLLSQRTLEDNPYGYKFRHIPFLFNLRYQIKLPFGLFLAAESGLGVGLNFVEIFDGGMDDITEKDFITASFIEVGYYLSRFASLSVYTGFLTNFSEESTYMAVPVGAKLEIAFR